MIGSILKIEIEWCSKIFTCDYIFRFFT